MENARGCSRGRFFIFLFRQFVTNKSEAFAVGCPRVDVYGSLSAKQFNYCCWCAAFCWQHP